MSSSLRTVPNAPWLNVFHHSSTSTSAHVWMWPPEHPVDPPSRSADFSSTMALTPASAAAMAAVEPHPP